MCHQYTPDEAALLLNLNPYSVRTFIRRGMINATRHDGRWRISAEEVDRYNRERRKPGPPIGRKQSEETKAKQRAARLTNNPMKGSTHTPEARAKMSTHSSQQPRGDKSHAWKGGRVIDTHGYVWVFAPDHPDAVGRYVSEHRLVMETVIGRRIDPVEDVHHINLARADNHPDNLQLMTHGEHMKLHGRLRRKSKP